MIILQPGEFRTTESPATRLRDLLHYDPETGIWTWRVSRRGRFARIGSLAGYRHPEGYWRIGIDGEEYLAHRLAVLYMTGSWPTNKVDHADCDRSNNKWGNIRQATNSQNSANSHIRSNNKSGYKGVSKGGRDRKFRAQIQVRGRRLKLGGFKTAEQAARAYEEAAIHGFGEYARVA